VTESGGKLLLLSSAATKQRRVSRGFLYQ